MSADLFAPRLELGARDTPLHPLDRLRQHLGCVPRLWIKRDDLGLRGLGGNKLRKLELLLADARAEGATAVGSIGGVGSNHVRLVAGAARLCDLEPYAYVTGDGAASATGGNLTLLEILGATVVRLDGGRPLRELDAAARADFESRCQAAGQRGFWMTYGGASLRGDLAYVAAAQEIAAQLGRAPRALHAALGTGGTIAGLAVGAALVAPEAEVVGWAVTPKGQQVFAGLGSVQSMVDKLAAHLREIGLQLAAPRLRVSHDQLGAGYARPSPEAAEAIELLAHTEAIFVDPVYTGKAFAGLLADLRAGRYADGDDVVFVHTGGLPGLFATPLR